MRNVLFSAVRLLNRRVDWWWASILQKRLLSELRSRDEVASPVQALDYRKGDGSYWVQGDWVERGSFADHKTTNAYEVEIRIRHCSFMHAFHLLLHHRIVVSRAHLGYHAKIERPRNSRSKSLRKSRVWNISTKIDRTCVGNGRSVV